MKKFVLASVSAVFVLSACTAPEFSSSASFNSGFKNALLPQNRVTQSQPGGYLCQVFLNDGRGPALPSFVTLSNARKGLVPDQLLRNPPLAKDVVRDLVDGAGVKERYIRYLRSITSNNQEARQLVRTVQRRDTECMTWLLNRLRADVRRASALRPGSVVPFLSNGATREQYLAYATPRVSRLREVIQINSRLYDLVLADLSNSRSSTVRPNAPSNRPPQVSNPIQPRSTQPSAPSIAQPVNPEPPVTSRNDDEFSELFERLYGAREGGLFS